MTLTSQSYRVPGHEVHEYELSVPLDHAGTLPGSITVFAREFVRDGGAHLPRLVWFQGGPGARADRPTTLSGWLERALEDYRVVLLDQRGTGRSTPADAATIPAVGSPAAQAEYLACLRADSIVADAEALRRALQGDEPWTALGQSYGGFITTCYLSQAPHGLSGAMITAGLPGLRTSAEDVYRATFATTAARNAEYFARYPQDRHHLSELVRHLDAEEELLGTGERLSPRRLLTIGIDLGTQSRFDALHYLLEAPLVRVGGTLRLSEQVRAALTSALSFAGRPLYAVLHESIYAQGAAAAPAEATAPAEAPAAATNWAAHRVRAEREEFSLEAQQPLLTGEHIFPWQFVEDPALMPLAEAAEILARRTDFPVLYHPEVLAENTVPAAAAIFYDDMFVPFEHSVATARAIRGLRPVITNAYQHDGIRVDGAHLVDTLIGRLHG